MQVLGGIFENNKIYSKLDKLNLISSKKNFWEDNNKVKKVVKEKKLYENIINSYKKTKLEIENLKDLKNLGFQENNQEVGFVFCLCGPAEQPFSLFFYGPHTTSTSI